MPHTTENRDDRRRRGTRALLIALILILLLLLCGLVYLLRSIDTTPERTPVLAEVEGVAVEWQAFGGGALGAMEGPIDVAYDGVDTVYVTVPGESSILAFDSDGQNGRVFVSDPEREDDTRTLAERELVQPFGIDVGSDGNIYVADRKKMALLVFSPNGEMVREIPMMGPKNIEVMGGRIYVLSDLSTLFVMDLEGNPLGQWGTDGRGQENLDDPSGVVVGDDGVVYISDLNNTRVLALSPDLEYLWQYGGPTFTPEEHNARLLSSPAGIALGADGNLYVVDGLAGQIQVISRSGEVVSEALGELGRADDQFYFPVGIDWMEEDLFVIADTQHSRIVAVRLTPQVLGGE